MNKTKIPWALNPDGTQGYTWNPITGCLNGCTYCYARRLANTRLRERYLGNRNIAAYPPITEAAAVAVGYSPYKDLFYPRFWKDRLEELPLGIDEPDGKYEKAIRQPARGIFVCDMSDLFGIGVPERWTQEVMDRIENYAFHRFYLLTKQPQNLIKFSPFTDNCDVGVSATNPTMFYEACYQLKNIEAKIKYISLEPLLDFEPLKIALDWQNWIINWLDVAGIKWVIIGAQTKPTVMPKIEWVKEIVEACDKAGISVFLKNNLYPLLGLGDGKSILHNNDNGTLRQEMPK